MLANDLSSATVLHWVLLGVCLAGLWGAVVVERQISVLDQGFDLVAVRPWRLPRHLTDTLRLG